MKVKFDLNMAQIMALVNAMSAYDGDIIVSVGTQSYGFYSDVQGSERHGYYTHPLTLRNSVGNAITLAGNTLTYSGSRNAPWVGGNSIACCFKAAGLISSTNEVAEQYRHVLPMSSRALSEEWWRHSYIDRSGNATSNYSVGADAPALKYDEVPDKEYRAI